MKLKFIELDYNRENLESTRKIVSNHGQSRREYITKGNVERSENRLIVFFFSFEFVLHLMNVLRSSLFFRCRFLSLKKKKAHGI